MEPLRGSGSEGSEEKGVQRGRFLRLAGLPGRRVLRFDAACGCEGCGIALRNAWGVRVLKIDGPFRPKGS